ncbi:hypothetical protein [Rubinisphaera margarita]|uniref:hypothetical protein n=1 Tax=Rubinisphaera margarita TaxID=2909586 RepID=UPI001EE7C8DE|nr:hypothetical protein [Rubinisphaera margarita]MCG6158331.1 hypothetical protein [Rubinisphaera margarita]
MAETYRYVFKPNVSMVEVQASLLLSVWATEALHGTSQVQLDADYEFDEEDRKVVIDASTEVGKDLNRILMGFLQREFEPHEFSVERITETPQPVAA